MLDRKFILNNIDLVRETCAQRRVSVDLDRFVELETRRLDLERELQRLRTEMNALARKGAGDVEATRETARRLKEEERRCRDHAAELKAEADLIHRQIPNLVHPETPIGPDESASREIWRSPGEPTRRAPSALDHRDLGEALGYLDMESGTKVAKPGFYFLKGELALLEIALMRFALDRVMEAGYEPCITPELANDRIMEGTGFVPRGDESNTFVVADEGLNLIATSEIPLCGMFADEILPPERLPIRVAGISHCFRTERAAGRATRGLYRVHQFLKIEMVSVCMPGDAEAIHREMLGIEQRMFDDLELPYRVIDVASGDLGAPAYRKYDVEAWMPFRGEGEFGEVTSTSNCTDYQARRLNIRYRDPETGKPALAYTLNGTGLAVGRAMIAILENRQMPDRSVSIPEKLRPYFGKDVIR